VIDVMGELLPHARELSAHAFERLQKLQVAHDTIGEVRGLGLMIGIELVKDRESREPDAEAMAFVAQYGLERELIIISCGPDGNVIRFIPPLITTMEELDQAIDTMDEALSEYQRR
jgi:4-aminobutyrate aminotransferase-like enzyme